MASFRFIGLGDLHILNTKLRGLLSEDNPYRDNSDHADLDEIIWPQMKILDQVESYAKERGISTVIQLGDLFDIAEPPQHILTILANRLYSSSLKWIIILGNHDFAKKNRNSLRMYSLLGELELLQNVSIYSEPTEMKINSLNIGFCPHPYTPVDLNPKSGPKLCFGHFQVAGAVMESKRKASEVASHSIPMDVFRAQDYWIIGDNHERQEVEKNIWYPGTPLQTRFSESFPKFFYDITATADSKQMKVKYNAIKVDAPYELKNIKVETLAELKSISFNEPKTYYRLIVKRDVAIPLDFLAANRRILRAPSYFGNTDEMQAMYDERIDLTKNIGNEITFEPTHGLSEFLIDKGLDKSQVKKGVDIVKNLLSKAKS